MKMKMKMKKIIIRSHSIGSSSIDHLFACDDNPAKLIERYGMVKTLFVKV
jgi:hypothetical protein